MKVTYFSKYLFPGFKVLLFYPLVSHQMFDVLLRGEKSGSRNEVSHLLNFKPNWTYLQN